MPTPRLLLLLTLLLLPDCAGDSFTSSDSNAQGGSSQNGTGGTASCSDLAETYLRAMLQARACNPDEEASCSDSKTLLDRCGCEVPVHPDSDAIRTAEDAFAEYEDANCPTTRPASCPDECPDVTSEFVASCVQSGGGNALCTWEN